MKRVIKIKECADCGVRFAPGNAAKRCALCRAKPPPPGKRATSGWTLDCVECGQQFAARTPAALYCSVRCKSRATSNRVVGQAVCPACGATFGLRVGQVSGKRSDVQHTCSAECRNEMNSRRVSAAYASGRMVNHLRGAPRPKEAAE